MSSGRRRQSATPAPAGGQDPKWMRPGLVGAGGSEPLCTQGAGPSESEVLPSGGVEKGSSSTPAMVHNLTVVEDEDVLDCGVCFHPLKPPIFQCAVGHALCSSCSEELKDARKCHLCGVAMPGGYQRCHALERVVDSICDPCPHVPYGCDSRLVYHARQEHVLQCPHAPCHCPGDGCSFVGSVRMLVEHLAGAHSWPCTAEPCASMPFDVNLRDGFNLLTTIRGDTQYLLLLNMASTPFGDAISAVWIRSVAAMASTSSAPAKVDTTCDLELRFRLSNHVQRGHYQRSRFPLIPCTCPSNGLPDPNASFQFFLPKYLGGPDQPTVHVVSAVISIETSI